MKTRSLVALVFIPAFIAVICFAPLWVWGIFIGLVSAVAAWELLRCTENDLSVRIRLYACVSAFAIPAWRGFGGADGTTTVVFVLFLLIMCDLIFSFRKGHTTLAIETVGSVLLAGAVMPILLGALVRLGLDEETSAVNRLLPLAVTFASDSGAYFMGVFLGKHPLAPQLSPKKTIEGTIGGFLGSIAVTMIFGFVCQLAGFSVNYLILLGYAVIGSFICQVGDLSFSAFKRLCDVKDYGNLIPGHGGVLDRFDSMHFTAPLIEVLVFWIPAILP
ncbi:MAG: phosphatidate cytidylyltransferase [Eubacteriales bacterium]|nr:phosphatidate cytidylyltransferase [Eubacteriales bacterium]